jgi:hypothetical protein
MAVDGVVDPFSRRLQAALAIQYYGFLRGAALLGLVFIRLIRVPSTAESPVEEVR